MPPQFNSFNDGNGDKDANFGTLSFPSDLTDQQYYPECIKFGIYERTGLDFEKFGGAIKEGFNNKVGDDLEQLKFLKGEIGNNNIQIAALESIESSQALVQAFRDNNNKARIEISKITPDLIGAVGDGAKSGLDNITSQNKERLRQVRNPTERLIQSIYLQMPEALVYNEQVDWQGSDLGLVGAFKEGQLTSGVVAGSLSNAGRLLGGAAGTLAGIIPGIGPVAAGIVGTVLGSETGISGGIESTFNIKANPYKEQTFQGVPFRPFEFSFNFRPRNDTEVEQVDQIIRSFRAFSKPKFKNTGQSGVFAYPHEFLIEFLTLNKGTYSRNKYIPQIKYCICKSVNTNWTGQGWKSFRDGAPVDITLTLSFEETEIVTQEDVLGKTNVGDFASFEEKGNF